MPKTVNATTRYDFSKAIMPVVIPFAAERFCHAERSEASLGGEEGSFATLRLTGKGDRQSVPLPFCVLPFCVSVICGSIHRGSFLEDSFPELVLEQRQHSFPRV